MIKIYCTDKMIAAVLAVLLFFTAQQSVASVMDKTSSRLPSIDTLFNKPYIDLEEWREKPVKHLYIHGGFRGTETKFSYYFPVKEKFAGRFFQYITPVPDSETLSQGEMGESDKIGFSIASGAYFIETNGGGKTGMGLPGSGIDPTIGAFRANEACAVYSRKVAKRIYGRDRIFGYAFGGSGGAYRTVGAIENTDDVWQGVVPYVLGSPVAIPNVFSVRMHAMRVLKNKFPQIAEAQEPWGNKNMYAGLNQEESQALKEVTGMGFPPKAWFSHKTMGIHAFAVLYQGMTMADPQYFTDFWTLPGYLGFNPPASLKAARLQQKAKIINGINEEEAKEIGLTPQDIPGQSRGSADAAWKSLGTNQGAMPVAFKIDVRLPDIDFLGGDMIIKTGNAAGKVLALAAISNDVVIIGAVDAKVLAMISPGDEVMIDNSNFLAAQTYHRHQVPGKEYPVWNQFLDASGKPIYPQRSFLLGPLFTKAASGVLPSGKIKGKVILVESLWDSEAFPWQADWYRTKVKENLGDKLDENFRLYYTDHANHADFSTPGDPTHLVSYIGVLQQALRDLSNWVENGIAPPESTAYNIKDGQVQVPANANERKGLQPTIDLKVDGKPSATVQRNKAVKFKVRIELPPKSGKLVSAEWDFEGKGKFNDKSSLKNIGSGEELKLEMNHVFKSQGEYHVTLRIATQQKDALGSPFAMVRNLERVRVFVK